MIIAKKMDLTKYGPWAFYLALVLAVVLAFVEVPWAVWLLAVLGLVVGVLNVSEKEATPFLLSTLAWMVAGGFMADVLADLPLAGGYLSAFLNNVVTFVGPAAAVVAITTLYYVTRD